MPSSKRRTIQLFKTLMGEDAARSVTIATTMWDQLWNEKQEGAAESRFEELKEHWKVWNVHSCSHVPTDILNRASSQSIPPY